MISVFCVNWGTKYPPYYVHKLQQAVERHLSYPHIFYVITDNPEAYDNSIPVTDDLPIWWNKLLLFRQTGDCIYFDLDVIIHNSIDWLIDDMTDKMRLIDTSWKNKEQVISTPEMPSKGITTINSSVMSWTDETALLDAFLSDPEFHMLKYGGDDNFYMHNADYQTHRLGQIYSYKRGASQDDWEHWKYRKDYSIATFSGLPDIHDCLTHQIVKDNWGEPPPAHHGSVTKPVNDDITD